MNLEIGFPPLRVRDPAVFGRVAVVMGGAGAERAVSLDSGTNVLRALRARGVDAAAVDGLPALLEVLRSGGRFDRVFNILHGDVGENGVLAGALQALGVPFTGSRVLGAALSLDKIRSKQVWQALGLPTPPFLPLEPGDDLRAAAQTLGLPVFVKPSCEGSSVGAVRVADAAALDAAERVARGYHGRMLVEPMVLGDELTVGILGQIALPSVRIVPAGSWYDYHAKYQAEDTRYLCPGLDPAEEREIRRLALAAFRALECSGWGRVDLMRERASGRLLLLEVNTAPGMTEHSLLPKAAHASGCRFDELCWRILEQTLDLEAQP